MVSFNDKYQLHTTNYVANSIRERLFSRFLSRFVEFQRISKPPKCTPRLTYVLHFRIFRHFLAIFAANSNFCSNFAQDFTNFGNFPWFWKKYFEVMFSVTLIAKIDKFRVNFIELTRQFNKLSMLTLSQCKKTRKFFNFSSKWWTSQLALTHKWRKKLVPVNQKFWGRKKIGQLLNTLFQLSEFINSCRSIYSRVLLKLWKTSSTSKGTKSSSRGDERERPITMPVKGWPSRTKTNTTPPSTGSSYDSPTRTSHARSRPNFQTSFASNTFF